MDIQVVEANAPATGEETTGVVYWSVTHLRGGDPSASTAFPHMAFQRLF